MFENLNFIMVIIFVLIHLFSQLTSKKLTTSILMSFAAGVGIAYIIFNLFPQLGHFQLVVDNTFNSNNFIVTNLVYIVIMLGFMVSHVIHKIDDELYEKYCETDLEKAERSHFWSDMTFNIFYNIIIGYIIVSKEFGSSLQVISFFIAFGLHFLMNDWGLRIHHGKRHDNVGRFILAGSMLLGGLIGLFTDLPEIYVVLFESYIIGALMLNVVKYELPDDHESSLRGLIFGVIIASIFFLLS